MTMMISFLWFGSQAMANPVTNWLQSEKEKTIAYQQKSWESAKEQTANTKEQLNFSSDKFAHFISLSTLQLLRGLISLSTVQPAI